VAARAVGWAAGQAVRYGKRRLSEAFGGASKKTREMAPLTSEKDVRVTYKKRYMRRGRKKRYVKSLKRWRSMQMRSEPSRIHFLVDAREYASNANTSRYFGCFMGLCAQSFYDTEIANLWNNITSTGGTDATGKSRHATLRIDHMSLSTIIRNTSSAGEAGGSVDIDVYKVVCIRDIPLDRWTTGLGIESMHASLKSELRQNLGVDIPTSDGGTGIAAVQTNAGTSSTNQAVYDVLFNAPPFLRYWRIIKCWKVHLGVGQTCSFNWRDSKNYAVARPECISTESGALAAKKRLTKGYIFNINGRWDVVNSEFESVSCVVEHSVRYNYKPMVPINSDTLVYDGV